MAGDRPTLQWCRAPQSEKCRSLWWFPVINSIISYHSAYLGITFRSVLILHLNMCLGSLKSKRGIKAFCRAFFKSPLPLVHIFLVKLNQSGLGLVQDNTRSRLINHQANWRAQSCLLAFTFPRPVITWETFSSQTKNKRVRGGTSGSTLKGRGCCAILGYWQ